MFKLGEMTQSEEIENDYFTKGLQFHQDGDYRNAIIMYKKDLETRGQDKKVLVLMGNAHYNLKELKEAEETFRKAITLDPNYSKAHYNLGIIYEETGIDNQAIDAYKKAIELDEGFGEAYLNLGDLYKARGDLENAILNYNMALAMPPVHDAAQKGLEGMPPSLLEKIRNQEMINRSDELIRLGIMLESHGQVQDAIIKYREALEIFPKSAPALFLLKLSQIPHRAPIIEKEEMEFFKLDTRVICHSISPQVREFLGKKLGNVEFESRAIENFFDGLKKLFKEDVISSVDLIEASRLIMFQEPEELLVRARESEGSMNIKETRGLFEKVIDIAPYLIHAYYLFGIFLEKNDEEDKALSLYKKASFYDFNYLDEELKDHIRDYFTSIQGLDYLGNLDILSILGEFHNNSRQDETVSLFRFLKYQISLEAEARIKYGFEKEERGQDVEALDAYKDAIHIDPANPVSHFVLGLAYETRGLEHEAMGEYEKTKDIDISVRGLETSDDITDIFEKYLTKTTKDGHRVGSILGRYFELVAENPEYMLELLGFIEDMKLDSVSKIIKSYLSTDMILEAGGKVIRDQKDFHGGSGSGGEIAGRVRRDELDFAEDLDREKEKIDKSKEISSIGFELKWKYKTRRSIRCVVSTGDGEKILAGSESGIVYLLDSDANSPWRYDSGANIKDIDISTGGRYGVYCNSEGRLGLLDCHDGKSLWEKDLAKKGVNSVAISSGDGEIAVATDALEIIYFDIKGDQKRILETPEIIQFLDMPGDGNMMLAASAQKIFIVKGSRFETMKELKANENIKSIALSDSGDSIAYATLEGDLQLMDSRGKDIWKNRMLKHVYGVSVSSNRRVVAGSINGNITMFSETGEVLWTFPSGDNIWDVEISHDGKNIVVASGLVFGNVYLFEIEE